MQPDPVDSTKTVSAADHGRDGQDLHEFLLQVKQKLELLRKVELKRRRQRALLDFLIRYRSRNWVIIVTANPQLGEKGFVLHSADAKGNCVRKNISVISRAGNGGSSSEGTSSLTGGNNHYRGTDSAYNDMPEETSRDGGSSSEGTDFTLSRGNNHHRETDSPSNDMPAVILDSGAQAHCTGNFNVLCNLSMGPKNVVLVAVNRQEMVPYISGSVRLARFELHDVHFCPELGNRIIVSGSMLDNDDYGYEFGRGKCSVTDLRSGRTVGEGCLLDGDYVLNYLKIPRDRTPGLVTRMWNAVCSALHRLGLNPQGPPM